MINQKEIKELQRLTLQHSPLTVVTRLTGEDGRTQGFLGNFIGCPHSLCEIAAIGGVLLRLRLESAPPRDRGG
jgi:hypothetical protein